MSDADDTCNKPVQDSNPANTVKSAGKEALRVLKSVDAMRPFLSRFTDDKLQKAILTVEILMAACDLDARAGTLEEKKQ